MAHGRERRGWEMWSESAANRKRWLTGRRAQVGAGPGQWYEEMRREEKAWCQKGGLAREVEDRGVQRHWGEGKRHASVCVRGLAGACDQLEGSPVRAIGEAFAPCAVRGVGACGWSEQGP